MSELRVEYAPSLFTKGYHCEDDVPVVRLEALVRLVKLWRMQTGAKESLSFRMAMRNLEGMIDDAGLLKDEL